MRPARTILVALVVTAGCAARPQTLAQLSDRLGNASQIQDQAAKDEALEGIAHDAADSGQPAVCLSAVGGIVDTSRRDRAAKASADTFNGNGNRAAAESLVERITDVGLRDRMRTEYANEPPAIPAPAAPVSAR